MTSEPTPLIFDAPRPRLFSLEPQLSFLEELARSVTRSVDADSAISLADVEIFLPTRRAVRALSDEFLILAGANGATLLPRIRAIGDVDEDEIDAFKGQPADELETPPAISAAERRITLAQFVAAKDRARTGSAHWAAALAAADELAKLIDSLATEEIDPAILFEIAPEGLAEHWNKSLEFLKIVIEVWPAYLNETGRLDAAARRVVLINRLTDYYREATPSHPVIIAGTTGSMPAVARLIGVIADLPRGAVLLPGVDLSMGEVVWSTIDDPHPQSGLKHLIEKGLLSDRNVVAPWPVKPEDDRNLRRDIINVALRPAASTDSWRDWAVSRKSDSEKLRDGLRGLSLIEADDDERESDIIALRIRQALETPEKSVSLITPDRDLGRRVSAKLRRWQINVDDSAGIPFGNTRCGLFLRLVARLLSNPADSSAFASILRHPLFGGALSPTKRTTVVNAVDIALRGLRPQRFEDLLARIVAMPHVPAPFIALIEKLAEPRGSSESYRDYLHRHIELAEAFASTDENDGAERLWRGDDGAAGANQVAELIEVSAGITDWARNSYHEIFDQLIANIAVRRTVPSHPRVAILGPLEARLQNAQTVILGGLNEGVWPRDADIDGFLSRGMRRQTGLPSPERRIGLAAHDFAQLSAAPKVILTRAKKAGGKPTRPSRWIIRLKNILEGVGAIDFVDCSAEAKQVLLHLDKARYQPISAPKPRPPVDARPVNFSVTRIEELLRDPYAIYAEKILRLRKLADFNEEIDARHIGNLFHTVFERFVDVTRNEPAKKDIQFLMELFEAEAEDAEFGVSHLPFWRDRARDAFHWFVAWHEERCKEGAPAVIEESGAWRFDHDGRQYELRAKADRIDLLNSGAAAIYDYKTGAPPPSDKQQKLFSPQLPLTALIVKEGGFESLGPVDVDRFSYLRVQNRKTGSGNESGASGEACQEKIAEAEAGLKAVLTHFNDSEAAYPPKPRPQFVRDFGDYDQLARRDERSAGDGAE